MKSGAAAIVVLCLASSNSNATSIVVQVKKDRIILAADTLAGKIVQGQKLPESVTVCKLLVWGNAAFSVAGNSSYKKTQPSDQIDNWDTIDDARRAHVGHAQDLLAVASEWDNLAVAHFLSWDRWDSRGLAKYAALHHNILLEGMFAGWSHDGQPVLLVSRILYQAAQPRVGAMLGSKAAWATPYSTNGISEELLEGKTNRAKAVVAQWRTKASSIPMFDQDWQWLRFVVERTGGYDPTVGQHADVLELFPNGQHSWLTSGACSKADVHNSAVQNR